MSISIHTEEALENIQLPLMTNIAIIQERERFYKRHV